MNKSIRLKYSLIGTLLVALFIAEQSNYLNFRPSVGAVTPTVIRQSFEEVPSITEVRDLLAIVYALERYKIENWSYPVSSAGHKGWDGFISDDGKNRIDWIKGLVPKYLDKLPRDPRMLDDRRRQYLYMSNGANYKLIVGRPSNCELVERSYPSLIDPRRNCRAFGFWSDGAVGW